MLRYSDLDGESPQSKVFQVPICRYCSAIERYSRQDIVKITVGVRSYAVQQPVDDLKEWKM